MRELDTQLIIAKEVYLADKKLFIPILDEVDEMQSILVATLNKLKAENTTKAKQGAEEIKKFPEKRTF